MSEHAAWMPSGKSLAPILVLNPEGACFLPDGKGGCDLMVDFSPYDSDCRQLSDYFSQYGSDGCQLGSRNYTPISLGRDFVGAVYDKNGGVLWKNAEMSLSGPAELEEKYRGMQVVFTPNVVFEGDGFFKLHFSRLENGRYRSHDCEEDNALDFPHGAVKAVLGSDGNAVWKNIDFE